jgi:cephalosporin hydroxylase
MMESFGEFCTDHKAFINKTIKDFMGIYYYSQIWQFTYWRGYKAFKYPMDMWIIQEIIQDTKPCLIIETGVMHGGSTLFLADMLELQKKGTVLAIENNMRKDLPEHPRITYINGDCLSDEVISQVKGIIKPESSVMVILDSAHFKYHVSKEINLYSQFVTPGCYLIVDDTCISGHPVRSVITVEGEEKEINPGPYEAVMEFLSANKDFEIDFKREKFFITTNPRGFLRKKVVINA